MQLPESQPVIGKGDMSNPAEDYVMKRLSVV